MIDYVNKENMESVRGIENPGMMGEMGKIIGFYRLYRQTAEEEWEEKAEVLLDEVMENCSLELPVTYGDGLCGVGGFCGRGCRRDSVADRLQGI